MTFLAVPGNSLYPPNRLNPLLIQPVSGKKRRFSAKSSRDILNLFHDFESMGVSLVSLDEQFDTSNLIGKVVRTMLAAFAELDRDQ
ncbi:MAG: recombinase family protein, partial [Desulfobacterales bacterium]|nr:recombinase family protein [Desulfobacterales bacterium]